ncbi:unnamed protein product [Cunninghamella blakesleeana]
MYLSKYIFMLVVFLYTFTNVICFPVLSSVAPKTDGVWKIGTNETITWDNKGFTNEDTVNIFIDEDRSIAIAGGSAEKGSFTFIVPEELGKYTGQTLTVIIIFRNKWHLNGGASFPVKIEN